MVLTAVAVAGWLLSVAGAICTHRGATGVRQDDDGVPYIDRYENVKLMWIGLTMTSFGATVGLVGTVLSARLD